MSKTVEEIRKELDANIPRDVISSRSQGGMELSYLEGWYVIDRLNQVLGQGNWSYKVENLRVTTDQEIEKNGKTARVVSYLATVVLEVNFGNIHQDIDARRAVFSDVGSGSSIDYSAGGLSAHEGAAKEAVTDALKRAAKNLGRSMGLALYDRTQEYVDEESKSGKEDNGGNQKKVSRNARATKVSAGSKASTPVEAKVQGGPKEQEVKRETINEMITKKAKVLDARGIMAMKDTIEYLRTTYKVQKKEELTDEQAKEFFSYLEDRLNADDAA